MYPLSELEPLDPCKKMEKHNELVMRSNPMKCRIQLYISPFSPDKIFPLFSQHQRYFTKFATERKLTS